MSKSYELLIVLLIILAIIGLGLWRAISLNIAHPKLDIPFTTPAATSSNSY